MTGMDVLKMASILSPGDKDLDGDSYGPDALSEIANAPASSGCWRDGNRAGIPAGYVGTLLGARVEDLEAKGAMLAPMFTVLEEERRDDSSHFLKIKLEGFQLLSREDCRFRAKESAP